MSNNNPLASLIQALLRAFCGGSQAPGQSQYPQQQQQQQYQQYPAQQQPQYPPPQQQQQQSWSQVAGGHAHGQNHQQNGGSQSHQAQGQGQGQAVGYYGSSPPNQHGGYGGGMGMPAGGVVGPHHPGHQNQDMINATNQRYQELRNAARHEGDEAHRCFAESQQAYQSGDGGRAHDLSVQGKAHQAKQDQLDDEASQWIYNENNKQSLPNTVDLHGLYVKEAIERTEAAIVQAQQQGGGELRVIVGKGIHSQGHVAKIKPAVEELMRKYNLSAHIDEHNTGVLIVDLSGQTINGRTRDAGGLVDEMSSKQDGDCVIM